ncbi:MAG: 3-methyl-2-oxobutanoate hydroxymethyltransferase [Opitutales bacterium]
MKTTARSVRALKGVRPLVCLTAYDAATARMAAEGGADLLLVGDSLGTVVLGLPDTVGVTLDMMIHHTAAVSRTVRDRLVVADLPFGVGHDSFSKVLNACRRLLQDGGAQAVKIEGGTSLAPVIRRLVDAGVPIMGHVGLMPQRSRARGLRRQGLTPGERSQLIADARAIDDAGVFSMVVECVEPSFMPSVTAAVKAPTVGIGSGRGCDGQVLVIHDLLGLTPEPPPFARPEARLHREAVAAVRRWAAKVRRPSSR